MAGKPSPNLFRATAQYYDLQSAELSQDDVPFYLDYAARLGGDILELACGTGRLAMPLAEAGHTVWGLDLSLEMLGQCQEKMARHPQNVQERVSLFHMNMADFSFGRTFPLIILGLRSFQALTREKEQLSCLANVRNHLADDSLFIIDVFKPHEPIDESWVREEQNNLETVDPRSGAYVRFADHPRKIDLENQIIYPDLIYYISHPDGKEERLVEPLTLKYYFEDQMRELLLKTGFTIKEEMGYYDKRPISEGPELIFVCSR